MTEVNAVSAEEQYGAQCDCGSSGTEIFESEHHTMRMEDGCVTI